jgi:hypothetical protein
LEFRHATVVDDVNIFVSHDVGWTAEQLAHMTVGIGLRLFPRVEPLKRWQRWSVEPNRDGACVPAAPTATDESGASRGSP